MVSKYPRLSRKAPRIIIPISGIHRGTHRSGQLSRAGSPGMSRPYMSNSNPELLRQFRKNGMSCSRASRWWCYHPHIDRSFNHCSIIWMMTDSQHDDGQQATIVLPEFVPAKWWHSLLHNQTAWLLKAALLYRRRRRGYQSVIIDVPYHLNK